MVFLMNTLEYLRELSLASVCLRLLLAIAFGGLIGLDRERKRRPAGFRTYMLVCMGAALTMLLGQYEYMMVTGPWKDVSVSLGVKTDVSRFGAQVINGIGFLGAGTIIVTGRNEVKGLTTAAGLWTSACMGLSVGAGFYECTLIAFVLILVSMQVFPAIETYFVTTSRNLNIYVRFNSVVDVCEITNALRNMNVVVYEIELNKNSQADADGAILELRLPKALEHEQVVTAIAGLECVRGVDEV